MRRRTVSLLIALAALAASFAPARAQAKNWKEIQYPPVREFQIPKPEAYTLKNGMTVFLMEDHELPLIDVTAQIRTGANYEPAVKTGLADIMATVQRTGGTSRMTGDQIDDFLAAHAARIETSMGEDSAYASMDCLKEDFDDVFGLFNDLLRDPAFAQEKLDVAKVQSNTAIARRNDFINAITSRELTRLVYGPESPLGRLEEYATITAITRDDLVAWHKKYYHPNNIYLGIVGDFDSKTMKKKIEEAVGKWPKGPAFSESAVAYRKQPNPGIYFVEKNDVTQANIALGHLGIVTKDDPDYFAVQVLNEVLGGGFASRLFSNVRSKKGLAYNVYGGVGSSFSHPGVFRAGLQTKSSTMAEAVSALREEIQGIISDPPNDAELKRAKESILNSFIFNYDSKEEVLSQQMTYRFYGLPADFLERYRTNIDKVTREDVARVAKKYIEPDKVALLVVGKPADFDRPVDTLGPVTKLDITIAPPPDTTPKVAKTAAGIEAGRKILAKVSAALGGRDADKVNAIKTSASMVVNMNGQAMSLGRSVLLVFPDKVRQTVKTPMGEQTVVINGTEGFMTMGGQSRPLPAEMLAEHQLDMGRDLRLLVHYHADPKLEVVAAGEEDLDGTKCQILAVTYRGAESRLWVDPTGRVLKQSYQGRDPLTRSPARIEAIYSDYKEVDGRQVPHKETLRIDGQDKVTLTLESFEVNPQVDVAAFEKPAA